MNNTKIVRDLMGRYKALSSIQKFQLKVLVAMIVCIICAIAIAIAEPQKMASVALRSFIYIFIAAAALIAFQYDVIQTSTGTMENVTQGYQALAWLLSWVTILPLMFAVKIPTASGLFGIVLPTDVFGLLGDFILTVFLGMGAFVLIYSAIMHKVEEHGYATVFISEE